jgi:uncharacterized protein YndB with AHSA1/START domain
VTEKVVRRFVLLDRTPAETWELLTEPRHLAAWLADAASVDARPGGSFAFGGPSMLGGDVVTAFSRCERPEVIDFAWRLFEVETHVRWSLERVLDMTRLVVTHRGTSTPRTRLVDFGEHDATAMQPKVCLEGLWWNLLARLKYYVATGRPALRVDLSGPARERLTHSMEVDVPAERAFAALTEGPRIDAWMGHDAKPSVEVGGRFDIGWDSGPGRVTKLEPQRALAYTWTYQNEPQTEVEWTVESAGGKAHITIVHSGFGAAPAAFDDYNRGWPGFLVRLALYLETGLAAHGWTGAASPSP